MKTILITGINGFLGSHLAKTLCKKYNIIGLEYSTENLFRLKDYSFKVYSSNENFEQIFKENQIFAVLHVATIYRSENEPLKSLLITNILLPVTLYELANKYDCKLFFNTDSFFNKPEFKYSYLSDYTLSKKQVLEWLQLIIGQCKLVNMKLFHMFGPDDSPNKFVSQIISSLKKNQSHIDLTLGEQKRDFIYVEDVVNAYQIILENYDLIPDYQEVEVGTGKAISLVEFIKTVKELINSHTELKFGVLPYRENEIMESIANPSSLMCYGWEPKYSLEQGIRNTISSN